MIVYKVVEKLTENSFWSIIYNNHFRLEYRIGKKTVPKIGRIFVFKSLWKAKMWITNRSYWRHNIKNTKILEGECNGTHLMKHKYCSSLYFDKTKKTAKKNIKNFWDVVINNRKQRKKGFISKEFAWFLWATSTPKETYSCLEFTPTKEIDIED